MVNVVMAGARNPLVFSVLTELHPFSSGPSPKPPKPGVRLPPANSLTASSAKCWSSAPSEQADIISSLLNAKAYIEAGVPGSPQGFEDRYLFLGAFRDEENLATREDGVVQEDSSRTRH